jgi:hypothetical protein
MLFIDDTNRYYVYAYLRKSDSTPYYIGKGHSSRAFASAHNVKVPIDKKRIVFIECNLTNVGACALERRLIKWYGRKDIGTGILRNLTDGGDRGTSGMRHSDETKKKISSSNKGKINSPEAIEKMKESKKGKKIKHSASFKQGQKPWNIKYRLKVINPLGKISYYDSVGEYEKISGYKQRNIYYLAYKYPDLKIKNGKFKDFVFYLESLSPNTHTNLHV